MSLFPDPLVKYGVCTASDTDEMAQLLGEEFARRDPPAVAACVTPSEFETFVRLYCPKAGTEGLSIVARCVETGEMCGALLCEDSVSQMPKGIDRLSPKFDPIFDILGQLGEEYRNVQDPQPGDSIHLFLLGVSRRFSGKGIASKLVAESLTNGASRGYRISVTEATNRVSQHIFRKHGFVERARRSYRDYQFDGQTVFESISEEGGPMLMDRLLIGAD